MRLPIALLMGIAIGGCGSSTPTRSTTSEPAASSSSLDNPSSARAISENEFAVTRAWMTTFRGDPHAMSQLVRLEPVEQDGRVVGMRVFGVRAGSIVDVLGLQNGDVLESVNGASASDPASWEGDTFVLVLRRQGVPRTHTIHVVDRLD